ncbi:MAG TPA: hypothetical protein VMY88_06335, partial [Acidimicrobiales bacterium]|nr:hypothetical protein [Acidimicrobiales bacterium]
MTPTYASLATFRIDLADEEAQAHALRTMILPSVRSTPGVICGHWTLDRAAGETLVLLHYEDE